jgi:hypothetical protein
MFLDGCEFRNKTLSFLLFFNFARFFSSASLDTNRRARFPTSFFFNRCLPKEYGS